MKAADAIGYFAMRLHRQPFQKSHPPIGVAGVSAEFRDALVLAGERGSIPMSINFVAPRILASHWEGVKAGAKRAGRIADRMTWRIARDVGALHAPARRGRPAAPQPR